MVVQYEQMIGEEDLEGVDPDYMLKCSRCGIGFERVFQLREHLEHTHSEKVEKQICVKCGADFLLKSQLDKHLLLHSPAAQVCKICSKTFANVYRLQRHLISHDESTDLRKFKCPECGKAFKFKHHLKEHIRIHSGEKPFACTNCGKRFSHSGSYSSHMTSKKCWVVNVKMRKPEENGSNGSPDRVDEPLRPLVPKAHENSGDPRWAQLYSQQLSQQFIPFDPTGGHLSAQYMALNGSRPFLPYAFAASHMINPLLTALPPSAYGLQHMLNRAQEKSEPAKDAADNKPEETRVDKEQEELEKVEESKEEQEVKEAVESKKDENQNEEAVVKSEGEENKEGEGRREESSEEVEESESADGSLENKVPDMAAVQKVLEIVGATVTQQALIPADKTAISKLMGSEALIEDTPATQNGSLPCRYCDETFTSPVEKHQHESYLCKQRREVTEGASVAPTTTDSNSLQCRHCSHQFTSPVELHQHERYLCQLNSDIKVDVQPLISPNSDKKLDNEDDNLSETSSPDKEGRQYHVRSWFSEEQRQILKGHYRSNPRPDKHELTNVASQLGLPKRVVQVWFQNTRAQDRRKGIPIPPVSACKLSPVSSQQTSIASDKPSPAYIPVVPQVSFSGLHSPSSGLRYYASSKPNGQLTSPTFTPTTTAAATTPTAPYNMQAEPLDLSVRKPKDAHSGPSFSSPGKDIEGEVLNLSQKPATKDTADDNQKDRSSPSTPKPVDEERSHQNNHGSPAPQPAHSRTPTPVARVTPDNILHTSPRHSPLSIIPPALLMSPLHRLSPSFQPSLHRSSPLLQPLRMSPSPGTPPHTLESSFSSTTSLDSVGTLNGELGKRARRKSWRQMESEEMEYDESLMIDEDSPNRKRRRSWKPHLEEGGQYACDQCDKLFSKQSSLARHKYEHSGARPFNCDDCGKAFKHKHHLTEHRRLHSGEKPFVCAKCGKRFSHSGSYSQHMNHRYKYCKPLTGELTIDTENSS